MNTSALLRAMAMAGTCLALSTGCQKHDDPVGSVPSDDIAAPTTPADTRAPTGATGPVAVDALEQRRADCATRTGTEFDRCMQGETPAMAPPEPEQSPPPVQTPPAR